MKFRQQTKFDLTRGDLFKWQLGHVESNLPFSSLEEMLHVLNAIGARAISPMYMDGDYGEFSVENFTILVPMKNISQISDALNKF